MAAAPDISRRKVPRFRIKVRVTCLMQDDANQSPVVFETENLSVQGMRISKQTTDRMPVELKLSEDRHHFWIYFD